MSISTTGGCWWLEAETDVCMEVAVEPEIQHGWRGKQGHSDTYCCVDRSEGAGALAKENI